MNWPEIFLICFGVGTLWSAVSLLLGGMHMGHGGHGHVHGHIGHGHGHVGHGHVGHGHGAHSHSHDALGNWLGALLSPSCLAVFLAWFGGIGYLLTRHSSFGLWVDLSIASALGLAGAVLLAAFLRWLQSHERPLESIDDGMIGVLGRVSSIISATGVGEIIYLREGSRRAVPSRTEDGKEIGRGEEVIVVRYEKGIAYVRTWEAMTQPGNIGVQPETLPKEIENVE